MLSLQFSLTATILVALLSRSCVSGESQDSVEENADVNLNAEAKILLAEFVDKAIIAKTKNNRVDGDLKSQSLLRDVQQSLNAVDAIYALAAEDPDRVYLMAQPDGNGRFLLHEDKVKKLFNKYIVGTCKTVMKSTGSGSSYDREISTESREMKIGLNRFAICSQLVKVDREKFLKEILEILRPL